MFWQNHTSILLDLIKIKSRKKTLLPSKIGTKSNLSVITVCFFSVVKPYSFEVFVRTKHHKDFGVRKAIPSVCSPHP